MEILPIILVVVLLTVSLVSLSILLQMFSPDEEGTQLKKFSSYSELQTFLKENAESYYPAGAFRTTTAIEGVSAQTAKEAGGAEDYSTTNVQVFGVDEADIVKNDGKYIYTVSGNKVVILDAYPAENSRIISTIELDSSPVEIFINKDRLVVFGNILAHYPYPLGGVVEPSIIRSPTIVYRPPKTFAYVYDISDRENPSLVRNITVDGNYIDSRMINDHVYVVINSYVNDLENITLPVITSNGVEETVPASEIFYFDTPDYSYMFTAILALNTQNDQEDASNKVILMGATQNIFVSSSNIYITYQKFYSYRDYTDRLVDEAILPNLPFKVVTEINSVRNSDIEEYEKEQKMGEIFDDYLNTLNDQERLELEEKIFNRMTEIEIEIQKEIQKTIIHRIEIDNGRIEYKAKGEVPGYLLNQFSMDEYNGYFRVATTTNNFGFIGPLTVSTGVVSVRTQISAVEGQSVISQEGEAKPAQQTVISSDQPPQPTSLNHLFVLDMDLNIVGRLEDLAPGESIYSARFIGDRAYLVTFKKIDPLFVVDLTDPQNPHVLGKLKIPGYSDYLHPYDENHIIGVGKEAVEAEQGDFAWYQGVKISLFDVSDVNNPKELSKFNIGDRGTDSYALQDHKAFLFSREKNLLVIPVLLAEIDESDYPGGVPPYAYGEFVWQGAYVFDISVENGFVLKGTVSHDDNEALLKSGYYYYSPFSVKRSLYIDDVLYTVSDKIIKANSLDDLSEIREVELPAEEEPIPIPLIK